MRDYGLTWRFFGLYGNSEPDHKRHIWSLLKRLSHLSPLPWLYSGGFNEILEPWKKRGGLSRSAKAVNGFTRAIAD